MPTSRCASWFTNKCYDCWLWNFGTYYGAITIGLLYCIPDWCGREIFLLGVSPAESHGRARRAGRFGMRCRQSSSDIPLGMNAFLIDKCGYKRNRKLRDERWICECIYLSCDLRFSLWKLAHFYWSQWIAMFCSLRDAPSTNILVLFLWFCSWGLSSHQEKRVSHRRTLRTAPWPFLRTLLSCHLALITCNLFICSLGSKDARTLSR